MRTEGPLRTEKKPLDLIFIDGKHDESECFGRMPDVGPRCILCTLKVPCAPLSQVYNALAAIDSATSLEQLPEYLASEFRAVREKATEKLGQLGRRLLVY